MASKKNRRNRKDARTRVTNGMTMINPNTAGIDVGSEEHWVCVPSDRAEENVRPFGVYSCDFRELAEWLKKCGVTSVAMESTGVYWIPLYQALEKQGFDVVLVNARHLKSVAGRPKTDVYDCQWIQRLHSYGLLNASFRPEDDICVIRSLQRHRDELTESTSRHVLHMQKCLQQMNVRLDEAVSDIMGKTGLAIIEAILSGEHNPSNLAKLRDRRVKADEKEIAKALEGDYREEHLFVLRQSLDSYKFIYGQMETCDREIKKHLEELEKKVDVNLRPLPPPTAGSKRSNRNQPTYDIRPYLYESFGVDLTQVPGFQSSTVLTLLSEVGADLDAWPTDKRFASWLGLCVNKEISGGKILKNSTRKVKNRASEALRMAASSLKNSDCYLGVFYRRIKSRRGAPKAVTATAHKLAVIFYHMVKEGKPYKEMDLSHYYENCRKKTLKNLKNRAQSLGFELVPVAVNM